jgi:hypothetical protein
VIQETVAKSKWTRRRKIVVAFAILPAVLLFAVIFPYFFWELHRANAALHGLTDALIAKQPEQAYEFTSSDFRAATDYPTFVKSQEALTLRMGDLKEAHVSQTDCKERSDGWHCTADVEMNFARGTLEFVFVLKKGNQSWKLFGYQEQ